MNLFPRETLTFERDSASSIKLEDPLFFVLDVNHTLACDVYSPERKTHLGFGNEVKLTQVSQKNINKNMYFCLFSLLLGSTTSGWAATPFTWPPTTGSSLRCSMQSPRSPAPFSQTLGYDLFIYLKNLFFFVILGVRHSACTIPTWPLFFGGGTLEATLQPGGGVVGRGMGF